MMIPTRYDNGCKFEDLKCDLQMGLGFATIAGGVAEKPIKLTALRNCHRTRYTNYAFSTVYTTQLHSLHLRLTSQNPHQHSIRTQLSFLITLPPNPTKKMEDLTSEPPTSINPYETLDLEKDATEAQIKHAYRRAALKHHPGIPLSTPLPKPQPH